MSHINFNRKSHTLESIVLGDSPKEINASIREKRREIHRFLDEHPVLIAMYGHHWNDQRGVDFTISANTLNFAWEAERYRRETGKQVKLITVLIGYDYKEGKLELWESPLLDTVLEVVPINIDPVALGLTEKDLGLDPNTIYSTQLEPAADKDEYEHVVNTLSGTIWTRVLDVISKHKDAPVTFSMHNIDIGILPENNGIFQNLGRFLKEDAKKNNRICYVEHHNHDLLEEHGPVRQRDYSGVKSFLENVRDGLFWHLSDEEEDEVTAIIQNIEKTGEIPDTVESSTVQRVMDLMSWAKRPGRSLDSILTINALNSAALGGTLTQTDPLPSDFVHTKPLIHMNGKQISEKFGEEALEVLGLEESASQEKVKQHIISLFLDSVEDFFEKQGFHFKEDNGLCVQFIRADLRKNLGMDMLFSELIGYNSVNTKSGYMPEERPLDGIAYYVFMNLAKDLQYSTSYGYGWDYESMEGRITGNDSIRIIEKGKPVEWSRVDVLAILSALSHTGLTAGSNFASIQEGFGMNFLENVWWKVPYINYTKRDSLKIYFKEALGIDIGATEYTDWTIDPRRSLFADIEDSTEVPGWLTVDPEIQTYRQAAYQYVNSLLINYIESNPEAGEQLQENNTYDRIMSEHIAPKEATQLGEVITDEYEQCGFAFLDITSQVAYLMWVKDHQAMLKQENREYLERLRSFLCPDIVEEQNNNLLYHHEMSGILTGLKFIPAYQDIIRKHCDIGPYDLKAMDKAIKVLCHE
ncbi:MAG: hypothetical protein ACLFR1_10225 [Spirochaetia bacterium]